VKQLGRGDRLETSHDEFGEPAIKHADRVAPWDVRRYAVVGVASARVADVRNRKAVPVDDFIDFVDVAHARHRRDGV
jgi:hypothetical protein